MLPGPAHVTAWAHRNKHYDTALAGLATNARWDTDPAATVAVARSLYSHLPLTAPPVARVQTREVPSGSHHRPTPSYAEPTQSVRFQQSNIHGTTVSDSTRRQRPCSHRGVRIQIPSAPPSSCRSDDLFEFPANYGIYFDHRCDYRVGAEGPTR